MNAHAIIRVGSRVRIARYDDTYGWNDNMDRLLAFHVEGTVSSIYQRPDGCHVVYLHGNPWMWSPKALDVFSEQYGWQDGRTGSLAESVSPKQPPAAPPPPYRIVSENVDIGDLSRRGGKRVTRIKIYESANKYHDVSFMVESDLMQCCGMGGLFNVGGSIPKRIITTEFVAELCAHILNAGIFGALRRNGTPQPGFSPGVFFFTVTDYQLQHQYTKSPLIGICKDVFGAEEIHRYKNQAHGDNTLHLFKMDLHSMRNVFVSGGGATDLFKPLTENIDPEGRVKQLFSKLV